MKISAFLVHEAVQNAPIDADSKTLFRQARAAIGEILAQLGAKFEFISKGCGRRLEPQEMPGLYGFCSLDHAALCPTCQKEQPS